MRKGRRARPGRVLFVGQAYYNAWYLSRALRRRGWRADVLNWEVGDENAKYYHGEDYRFRYKPRVRCLRQIAFYLRALVRYDVFHFSNAHCMSFGPFLRRVLSPFGQAAEIRLLKRLGKRIVYSNNGCLDGVSQTSFSRWGDKPVCNECPWQHEPAICSDERNLAWGKLRNRLADYQCTVGGNRADYNDDPTVHEVPEFYCLDPDFWHPELPIPIEFLLSQPESMVKVMHSVGNYATRTAAGKGVNLKSTHIWIPTVGRLRQEGFDVELLFFTGVPNRQLRYYQAQCDIVVDMLTFGFFGANVREALMLGKPVICYLRPEWLESMKQEIPEYVEELPIVSATPATAYRTLRDLVESPERRHQLGRQGREFALKWHAADVGAKRVEEIYLELLTRGPTARAEVS